MPDILLDSNGDIDLTGNTMRLTPSTEQEARQQVFITLSTYKGEWDFNTDFGIPYLANNNNSIQLLGVANQRLLDSYMRQGILDNSLVTDIIDYNSTLNKQDRSISVSFQAATPNNGIVGISETITP